jgi:hypothetical protein
MRSGALDCTGSDARAIQLETEKSNEASTASKQQMQQPKQQ